MPKLKNRFMDEVLRIVRRFMRLELCAVDKVHCHKEPYDKKFNTVDVVMRDRADKDDPNPIRKQLPVLQNMLGGHCGGYNWTPRVGDLVWVFFYAGRQGIVLANAWGWHEYPVCRPGPYDIADKNSQWLEPFRDIKGDFIRQPYPKLKKPYCFRWFHGPVTGSTGKGRDWAWLFDYCQEGDGKPECDLCKTIDSISRDGNRGFKFYSHETESKVAHPLRDLFFNESGSFWMFDAKSCADCSECDGSCCSEMYTEGRGYWTIQGAIDYQTLRGHLRHNPYGSMDLHTETEDLPIESETSGVRVAVVSALDSGPDFAWEIKDFLTNAYAKAFKDGKIKIESQSQITLKAPAIILDGNVHITGNNQIDGSCAHGSCSCPCSGAGGGVTCPTTSIKLDAATGRCMTREPTGEWTCLGDKVLTSICCLNSENIVGCNSAGECWKWDGEEWSCLSTSPTLVECSIGIDGTLFGVHPNNPSYYIYKWTGSAWEIAGIGVHHIAVVDATHVYFLNGSPGTFWFFDGAVGTQLEGTTYIDSISVAKDGSLFAILHSDGSLVKWSGSAWGSSLGTATGLKQIAAKSGTMVWAVGSDDKLWYWNGLTWTKSSDDTVSVIALAMG